jgi:tetratricopeptide (TPR) repeat protein
MPGAQAIQVYHLKRLSVTITIALSTAAVLVLAGTGQAWAAQTDYLARARQFYNDRQYEQAIATAERALATPALAARAKLIIGRAHLERFRTTAATADLLAGRAALAAVRPDTLSPGERLDLLLGLGEALYLDSRFGAAAELFSSALDSLTAADARDTTLDWWASAQDRLVQSGDADPTRAYQEIAARMEDELGRNPASTTAAYWLAAASRGAGHLDRAWNAAIAGWVRAVLSPTRGLALRSDLDLLVLTAIIPERARELGGDREQTIAALIAEWERVKSEWKH